MRISTSEDPTDHFMFFKFYLNAAIFLIDFLGRKTFSQFMGESRNVVWTYPLIRVESVNLTNNPTISYCESSLVVSTFWYLGFLAGIERFRSKFLEWMLFHHPTCGAPGHSSHSKICCSNWTLDNHPLVETIKRRHWRWTSPHVSLHSGRYSRTYVYGWDGRL